jgi:hypothetical protein
MSSDDRVSAKAALMLIGLEGILADLRSRIGHGWSDADAAECLRALHRAYSEGFDTAAKGWSWEDPG